MSLPNGTDGDEVIRKFYRAGRTVDVAIYADAACTTPAVVGDRSSFAVDIAGMPPVDSAMPALAWGRLSDDSVAALEAFTLPAGEAGSFAASWTFDDGVTGFEQMTLCVAGDCGDGAPARIGDTRIRPGATSGTLPLHGPTNALAAGDVKMFILGGRDATGMNIESEFFACSSTPAGRMCGQGPSPIGTDPGTNSSPASVHRRPH
jgi:hypothetical protein